MTNETSDPEIPFIDRFSTETNTKEIASLELYINGLRPALRALRSATQLLSMDITPEMRKHRSELLSEVEEKSGGEISEESGFLIQFSENKVQLMHGISFSKHEGDVKGFLVLLDKYKPGASILILDEGGSRSVYDEADLKKKKLLAKSVYAGVAYNSLAFVNEFQDEVGYTVEDLFKFS